LMDKRNNVNGILGISVDITEKVKMANELITKNRELESMLNKHKQFLSNQEHDLRTPNIAIISAATAILQQGEDELSADNRIMIQGILDSAQSLLDYNDSILNALSLSDPNEELSDIRFLLSATVERIFNINKVSAYDKGIE